MNQEIYLFILRFGLGSVFAIFGFDKLPNPEKWVVYYPASFNTTFFSLYSFLKLQGLLEFAVGLALIAGFMTRAAAAASALVLFCIIFILGWDPISVRDAGLFCSALAIVGMGPGKWSLDALSEKIGKKT